MYCNASSFFSFFQLPKLAATDVICTIGKTRKIRNIDENSLVINSLKQALWPIIFYPETLQKSIICYTGYNPVPGFVHRYSQMFFEIGVLKKFTIFTGKHVCWNLF